MSRIIVQAPVVSNQAWGLDAALKQQAHRKAARVFVDELPREAFGVRPACPPSAVLSTLRSAATEDGLRRTGWRCRKAWGGPKAGASSTHSKRFAHFGCGLAALCSFAAMRFTVFLSRIQRAVEGQVEFASHARVGRVGEGKFAVGGVLGLAAARNGAGFIRVHSISPASA